MIFIKYKNIKLIDIMLLINFRRVIKMKKISFLLLFLLISFGSISAVLFTPALPEISHFFHVTEAQTQLTITLFLAGYALGQLLYGPLGNLWGRKKTLYCGLMLATIACLLCFIASAFHWFWLLVFARFVMALGSSVGLQMTFTLISDNYDAQEGRRIVAYAMMSFAITPGLGVTLGGFLTTYLGWQSCFGALLLYSALLFFLVQKIQDPPPNFERNTFSLNTLFLQYGQKFKNSALIIGGILMGTTSACNYIFVSIAPFITHHILSMDAAVYGLWNLLPPVGIIAGTQLAAYFSERYSMNQMILFGLITIVLGALIMLFFFISPFVQTIGAFGLFFPQGIIFFGGSFILVNASARAMQSDSDKSNASSVMSFISMAVPTSSVLLLGFFHTHHALILPVSVLILLTFGFILNFWYIKQHSKQN